MANIKTAFRNLRKESFRTLYTTYVRPILEYAARVFSANLVKHKTKLKKVQSSSQYPVALKEYPVALKEYPVALKEYPVALKEYPVALKEYPVALKEYPVALKEYPVALKEYPVALKEYPVALKEYWELRSASHVALKGYRVVSLRGPCYTDFVGMY
ncbi:uncharacterized protein [Procambarus clarkii]|uniref:uncharacterized protein n=1 Tax=Procambarus clarkii TaxID=6728 RepID=UPI0037430E88